VQERRLSLKLVNSTRRINAARSTRLNLSLNDVFIKTKVTERLVVLFLQFLVIGIVLGLIDQIVLRLFSLCI
jgi:hypothetical protein